MIQSAPCARRRAIGRDTDGIIKGGFTYSPSAQLQLNGPSGEELGGIFDSVVADPRGPVNVHVFAVVVAAR